MKTEGNEKRGSEHSVHRCGYVALIGAPNAGKSTLLNQLLQEKISITASKPQTTRNRIMGVLTRPTSQMILVDTPGIHQARDTFNRTMVDYALEALKDVDLICFLIEPQAAQRDINRQIVKHLRACSAPVILVVNKVDLLADKSRLLPIIDEYRQQLDFAAVVPLSALSGDGTDRLIQELELRLPEGPPFYPEDTLTDLSERFLVAELIREKVFHLAQQEVPYAVAVTIDQFKEESKAKGTTIEATIHVERSSQKAIIIGKGGKMLKEIGIQARRDIEHLLDRHVYLGLFVRVQKNWRQDRRMLMELGYPPTH
ncbi:MAG: GTPase Era [Syntrophobacteraceae bacterium]